MKTKRPKAVPIIILGILSALFACHWLIIFLHIGPVNPISEKTNRLVRMYVDPVFSQNWALFAPNPTTSNVKLWYQCKYGKEEWTNFKDPGAGLLKRHYSNRFSYYGKLYYIYDNVIRSLNNYSYTLRQDKPCALEDAQCNKDRDAILVASKQYQNAKRFVSDLCERGATDLTQSIASKFYYVETFPKDFSKRNIADAQKTPQIMEYP